MPGSADPEFLTVTSETSIRYILRPDECVSGDIYTDCHDVLYNQNPSKYTKACRYSNINGGCLITDFSSISLDEVSMLLNLYYNQTNIECKLIQEITTDEYIAIADTHDRYWVFWYTV